MARERTPLSGSDSGGTRPVVAVLAALLVAASVLAPVSTSAALGLGDSPSVVAATANADETTVANDGTTTVETTTTVANDETTTVDSGDATTTTTTVEDGGTAGNDESVTIRGSVTDAESDPAANDTLRLVATDGNLTAENTTDRNQTDERGRYRLDADANRSYDLTYRQGDGERDGRPAVYAVGEVNASANLTRNVSLPAASVLNLTVVAENGTAVENATVRLTHARDGANATLVGRTDSEGRLRVGGRVGVELAGNVTAAVAAPNASLSDREVAVSAAAGHEQVVLDLNDSTPPTLRYDVSTRTANVSELVTFDASNSTDASGVAATKWTFPTDTVSRESVGYRFSERGNYSVNLSVTDEAGNVNWTTVAVSVVDRRGPEAVLAGNATNVTVNESVAFDASGSSDVETSVAEYRWDFDGDGTAERTTTNATAEHTYAEEGTYDATVTVVDETGNLANATRRVRVEVPPPTANVTVSDRHPVVGETVRLDASGTAAVGNVTEYEWEIRYPSDTLVLGGPTVERNFSETGSYEVTLNVTDERGRTDATNVTVEVVPSAPPNVSYAPREPPVGESVTFWTNRTGEFDWDFDGDGTVDATSESANVTSSTATHRFDEAGEYVVTLVDAAGREVVQNVTVTPADASGNTTDGNATDGNATDGDTSAGGGAGTGGTGASGGGTGGAAGGGATGGSTGGAATGGSSTGGTSGSTGGDATDDTADRGPVSPTVTVKRAGDGSDRVVAAVENATVGDRAEFRFPDEFGSNRSAFESIAVVTDGASNFSLSVAPLSNPPDGTPSPDASAVLSYLHVEERNFTDDGIGTAQFRFRVAAATLAEAGVSPGAVDLYRYHDGEWQSLATDHVGKTGGFHRFEAASPGFSVFAVGLDTTGGESATTSDAGGESDAGDDSETTATTTSKAAGDSRTTERPDGVAESASGGGLGGVSGSTLSLGLFAAALLAAALWGYLLS